MLASDLAGTAGALVLVVALVLLLRFANRFLAARRAAPGGAVLATVGQLALDNRRRLLLVRCGETHALLLTGGTTDIMLPWADPAAGPAAERPGTAPAEWRPFSVPGRNP